MSAWRVDAEPGCDALDAVAAADDVDAFGAGRGEGGCRGAGAGAAGTSARTSVASGGAVDAVDRQANHLADADHGAVRHAVDAHQGREAHAVLGGDLRQRIAAANAMLAVGRAARRTACPRRSCRAALRRRPPCRAARAARSLAARTCRRTRRCRSARGSASRSVLFAQVQRVGERVDRRERRHRDRRRVRAADRSSGSESSARDSSRSRAPRGTPCRSCATRSRTSGSGTWRRSSRCRWFSAAARRGACWRGRGCRPSTRAATTE